MRFPKVRWMRLKFAVSGLALLAFLTVAVGQEKTTHSEPRPDNKNPAEAGTTGTGSTATTNPSTPETAGDPFDGDRRKGQRKDPTAGGGGNVADPFGSSGYRGSFGGFGGAGRNTRLVQGSGLIISWSKNNDQLRGFSITTGHWTPLNIKKQKTIIPVVGDGVAAVRVGSSMAAYSPKTGTWDVLKLTKQSKAVPVVHTRLVTVNDNGFLYTFAADSAKWTSPDDPKMQRPGPSVGGEGPGVWPEPRDPSSPEANSIISEYRGGKLTKGVAIAAVRRAIFEEFDRRQNAQTRQAAKLRRKLEQLEAAIRKREQNRNAIVERRVKQLLDPPASGSQGTSGPGKDPSTSR